MFMVWVTRWGLPGGQVIIPGEAALLAEEQEGPGHYMGPESHLWNT